jgi:hypothetical protein
MNITNSNEKEALTIEHARNFFKQKVINENSEQSLSETKNNGK